MNSSQKSIDDPDSAAGFRQYAGLFVLLIALLLGASSVPVGAVPADVSSVQNAAPQTYIVMGESASAVADATQQVGGDVTAVLPVIDGASVELTPQMAAELSPHAEITTVMQDISVRTSEEEEDGEGDGDNHMTAAGATSNYSEVVGANQIWSQGSTGDGVTVAVLDTGISSFPGLAETPNSDERIVAWKDFINNQEDPLDGSGHGSHIAGIIANSDSGSDGNWNGVAPYADLVVGRVLDSSGTGSYTSVISGIQWVIDNKDTHDIEVLNLSLVADVQSPYWADPLNVAVMEAWEEGITVVAAAGNTGPDAMTIGVPGNNPYVITVGAFTDDYTPADWSDDYITPFSAAGPTLDGFAKPDLVAPGAHMVSTLPHTAAIHAGNSNFSINNNYYSMAGTSQSTAVVSGIVALMLDQHPSLTPDQVKYRLMNTALVWRDENTSEIPYSIWQQGAGRLNGHDAVLNAVTGDTANVGLNITDDINGVAHYEGAAYYDETTGEFVLPNSPSAWSNGYNAWAGGYNAWAGGYNAWAGGYNAWAGGYNAWAGGYNAWAGGYNAWAGGYSAWAGGYNAWAGGYSAWAGSYGDATFASDFAGGAQPDPVSSAGQITQWEEATDWEYENGETYEVEEASGGEED